MALTVLLAVSNALFLLPLVRLDGLPVIVAVIIFIEIIATSSAITYTIRALDHESIVSLRRVFGLAFASNLVWTIPLTVGSLFTSIENNQQPSLNEFVLGAFIAWSFELLVINGAFLSSTAQSLGIAAIQPTITFVSASVFIVKLSPSVVYSTIFGLLILGITTTFLLKFKTFKTAGVGINSLQTFQSFLKSWVSQKPANLESFFMMYSREEPVSTKIVIASGGEQATLVLPGVHPGPFFPVGSYNISELIFHELRGDYVIPMILHGVGGHERNLPTNELAKRYAVSIAAAAKSTPDQKIEKMKGPSRFQVGPTSVTTLEFGNQVIAFLSNAPYNTDDLGPNVIEEAVSAAAQLGIDLMLVDSHNSIGGNNCDQPGLDWKNIFSETSRAPESEFKVGVAHSSELHFEHGSDISDGGIAVLVFRNQKSTHALVTSDSNNALVGLRQAVVAELAKENVDLIELCTSDTHNSAARSLSNRGYRALGEDTSSAALVKTIVELEKLAESRLTQGYVTTIASQATLPLIGDKPLNDFAALTKDTLSFAKTYAAGAVLSALVVCCLALFF